MTADWQSIFPSFDVYRPRWLLRRIGPVMQGILLERTRSADRYRPTSHIHALTRPFPTLTLMLLQCGTDIRHARHEQEFRDVAAQLERQTVLPLREPPTIPQIVDACHAFARAERERGCPPAVYPVEDSVLIAAASGERALADAGLRLAEELVAVWPKWGLPLDWPGSDAWLQSLRERAANVDLLDALIAGQVAQHKLGSIRAV
ncbi:hypothetical protein ABT369_31640 [Dactylosporangium sp. NPDC000244]|uniref:hypothetical protein n=1 Tax=Dactylosporangium sp. NPDC000244 TaxID=3154365 RepID=UPI0033248A30